MSNHKIEIRRANVEKILLGAEKVFAEKGFAGAAMADIAAEVQLPRSNLHYYFSTKTDLYSAVLLGLLEVWKQDALCFETYDDPRLVQSSYIRAKMNHSRTRPHGSKVWANEMIHGAPTLGLALDASLYDWRMALSFAIRDQIVEPWFASTRKTWDTGHKRVYYLSLEFLVGRTFSNAVLNLGLREEFKKALYELGQNIEEINEVEFDAGLGNGGLGRLAACFLDSMATLELPCYGYGIRYRHGLFRQRIEDGWQVELPETWLEHGNPWEFDRREAAYEVGFGGAIEYHEANGAAARFVWTPSEKVIATAVDTPLWS